MSQPSTSSAAVYPFVSPDKFSRGLDQLFSIAAGQTLDAGCECFYFLRHGQTPCNALRIFQGPDEPLNALGIEQAHSAAGLLAHEPIAAIVSSDMARAMQTAGIVAARPELARLAIVPHAGLRERNFGALNGTSSVNIDWACHPNGGETLEVFVSRTRLGLSFALTHREPTLVVAHGGTLYVLLALLKLPLNLLLLGNAEPLLFQRSHGDWEACALDVGSGATILTPTSAAPNIS